MSRYARERLRLPAIGAACAFGAPGGVLALMGVGVPFIVAAIALAICAGVVVYAAQPHAAPAMPDSPPEPPALQSRVDELLSLNRALRHDLRGVLSPALMMSDRLLSHADPAIRRAGEAVVKSVDRATAIIAASRDV